MNEELRRRLIGLAKGISVVTLSIGIVAISLNFIKSESLDGTGSNTVTFDEQGNPVEKESSLLGKVADLFIPDSLFGGDESIKQDKEPIKDKQEESSKEEVVSNKSDKGLYSTSMEAMVNEMEANKRYESTVSWTEGYLMDSELEEVYTIATLLVKERLPKSVVEVVNKRYEITADNDLVVWLNVDGKETPIQLYYKYNYLQER